jgi:hypothetical protein
VAAWPPGPEVPVCTNCDAERGGAAALRVPRVIGAEACAERVSSTVCVLWNINHVLEQVYFCKCS